MKFTVVLNFLELIFLFFLFTLFLFFWGEKRKKVGGVDLETLPGTEALQEPGTVLSHYWYSHYCVSFLALYS